MVKVSVQINNRILQMHSQHKEEIKLEPSRILETSETG